MRCEVKMAVLAICISVLGCRTESRMDRTKLQIGAYCLAARERDEAHVRDMRACGIDFVYGIPAADRATLDLCARHGLGVIATGAVPFWHGMDGSQAGEMRERKPMGEYEKAMDRYVDHPAIWMLDYVDEPSALDYPYIGEVTEYLKARCPAGVLPYINLYPNYAVGVNNDSSQQCNQLGTRTYREHLDAYSSSVGLDYACFDYYLYSARGAKRRPMLEKFHENFRDLAEMCRRTGRSLWYIPQVNSSYGELWLSENMLRFQAYLSMCYGTEVIAWACWGIEGEEETPDMPGLNGWWTNNVLTLTGEKTEQYDKLRKVNGELHWMGVPYMRYRNVGTRFGKADDGAELVIGEMTSRSGDGARALFILASDDPFDERPATHRVTVGPGFSSVEGGGGPVAVERKKDGRLSFSLPSNHAVLVY